MGAGGSSDREGAKKKAERRSSLPEQGSTSLDQQTESVAALAGGGKAASGATSGSSKAKLKRRSTMPEQPSTPMITESGMAGSKQNVDENIPRAVEGAVLPTPVAPSVGTAPSASIAKEADKDELFCATAATTVRSKLDFFKNPNQEASAGGSLLSPGFGREDSKAFVWESAASFFEELVPKSASPSFPSLAPGSILLGKTSSSPPVVRSMASSPSMPSSQPSPVVRAASPAPRLHSESLFAPRIRAEYQLPSYRIPPPVDSDVRAAEAHREMSSSWFLPTPKMPLPHTMSVPSWVPHSAPDLVQFGPLPKGLDTVPPPMPLIVERAVPILIPPNPIFQQHPRDEANRLVMDIQLDSLWKSVASLREEVAQAARALSYEAARGQLQEEPWPWTPRRLHINGSPPPQVPSEKSIPGTQQYQGRGNGLPLASGRPYQSFCGPGTVPACSNPVLHQPSRNVNPGTQNGMSGTGVPVRSRLSCPTTEVIIRAPSPVTKLTVSTPGYNSRMLPVGSPAF